MVDLVAVLLSVIQVIQVGHHHRVSAKKAHHRAVALVVAMLVLLAIQEYRVDICRHASPIFMIHHMVAHLVWDTI